jgi:hypothetical protein
MRCRQRFCQLSNRVGHPVRGPGRGEHLAQRHAGDELLDHQQVAAVDADDVVNGDDVRMVEGGGGPCFADEALDEAAVCGVAHRLDGDEPIETRVAGAIDLAHAATPDERLDFVVLLRCPDHAA